MGDALKILWLKTELLHPIDKGGKIRTYQMLKHLKRNHQVTYLSLCGEQEEQEAFDKAEEYSHHLITIPFAASRKYSAMFYADLAKNLVSPLPYALSRYHCDAMKKAVSREVLAQRHDVVVSDFLVAAPNTPRHLPCAKVLFQHNVEAMIWKRHAQTASSAIKKAYFYGQWAKMRAYEQWACHEFDSVVAVSDSDRRVFFNDYGVKEVYDVPTGVDTDYFEPQQVQADSTNLVFTGSMDWLPNEDAMVYFADAILPRIVEKVPQVTVTVVGRKPTSILQQLAKEQPRIKLTGRVEDIRPHVAKAAVYIVPLRIGGGTRIKIYEAMAMQKAVVSTSIGAEGLPLRNGEEIFLADTPDKFAQFVVNLLQSPDLAQKLGQRARQVVCERFGWEKAANTFAEICERAVQAHRNKR